MADAEINGSTNSKFKHYKTRKKKKPFLGKKKEKKKKPLIKLLNTVNLNYLL
jgi:hypothetical protein